MNTEILTIAEIITASTGILLSSIGVSVKKTLKNVREITLATGITLMILSLNLILFCSIVYN